MLRILFVLTIVAQAACAASLEEPLTEITVKTDSVNVFTHLRTLSSKKGTYLIKCREQECTSGQQCNKVGDCEACPIGTFAPINQVLQCSKCPAGTHGTDAIDKEQEYACKSCSAGFYTNEEAQAECKPCEPGRFQNVTRQTECMPAGIPDDIDLCNETHFFVEGASDMDTAKLPVRRNGAKCPSSSNKGTDDLPKWAKYLLYVVLGLVIGCMGYCICA